MVLFSRIAAGLATATLFGLANSHPGEHHDHEAIERSIQQREVLAKNTRRSMDKCAQSAGYKAMMQRSIARRAAHLKHLRYERGIGAKSQKYRRDLATLEEFEDGEFV